MVAITNIVVGSLAASAAYGSPLSNSCKTYQSQLANLVQEVPQAQHFCSSWLSSSQTTSPIKGVSGSILTKACQCATQDTASARNLATTSRGNAGALAGAAAASVCKNVQLARILSGIKNVQFFCSTFDPTKWGHGSPIFGATAQSIQQACQCVLSAATASPLPIPVRSTTSIHPPPPATPAPAPGPSGPMQPFHFCPGSSSQIAPFKLFCKTPLWKAWACSCSSVAQSCFPNQQLTWCPRPSTSAPASSSTSMMPSPSVTTISTPSTTPAPVSSSTTPAPISSSTPPSTSDVPTSTTDAPVVVSSTTDAPIVSSTTDAFVSSSPTDAPVAPSSSSSDDGGAATSSSDASAQT